MGHQEVKSKGIIINHPVKCNSGVIELLICNYRTPTCISEVVYFYAVILASNQVNIQDQVRNLSVDTDEGHMRNNYKTYVIEHNNYLQNTGFFFKRF